MRLSLWMLALACGCGTAYAGDALLRHAQTQRQADRQVDDDTRPGLRAVRIAASGAARTAAAAPLAVRTAGGPGRAAPRASEQAAYRAADAAADRATRRDAGREAQRRSAAPATPPSLRTGGPLAARRMSADAGPDTRIVLPDTRATLTGAAVGNSVAWSQVSGPGTVVFQAADRAQTGVAASTPGTYVLRLSARDHTGRVVATDDVAFTVAPNPVALGSASTPLDHIRTTPRPALRSGHGLLPLGTSSCAIAPEIRLELMRHWGYAGSFGGSTPNDDPVLQEVKARPGVYPALYGVASLYPIFDNDRGQRPDLPRLPAEVYMRDAAGTLFRNGNGNGIVSPLASDASMRLVGEFIGGDLARVEAAIGQPIRLMTNEGEYGLWITGDNDPEQFWGRDPRVLSAYRASGMDNWFDFISFHKARHERQIKEGAFSRLSRGRPRYVAYQEGFAGERGRWAGWSWFIFRWEHFLDANGRPTVSDYSSPELYYNFHNSGWSGLQWQQGIPWDGITQILRAAGGVQALGQRNLYPFVSQGWDGGDSGGISDDESFVGAMKVLYAAGAIGAVSGYFTCSGPQFEAMRTNGAIGAARPTQVRGLINLARVHALFTHLDHYLLRGALLPGNGTHPYRSFDLATPTMEFDAVGETTQTPYQGGTAPMRTARVVARRIPGEDRWLVVAWANTGVDRDIRTTIDPQLGQLTLRARRAGSVYEIVRSGGATQVRLIDTDAMNPTAGLFP